MKKPILPSLVVAFVACSSLAAQVCPPVAPAAPAPPASAAAPKAPNKPVAPVPPGDPFVRDPRAAKTPPSSPAALPTFHTLVVETYLLPTSELATILGQETSGVARHELMVALHTAGKARLVGLTAHSMQSSIRCVVDSIDEVRYWTEFDNADAPGEAPRPTAANTRNTGVTEESEFTLDPDGQRAQLLFILKRDFFRGLREYSYPVGDPPVTAPIFSVSAVTSSGDLRIDEPTLIGSASTPREEGAGAESWVTFATARPLKVEPPARPVKAPVTGANIEVALYSLDRTQARQILTEAAAPGDIHRRVTALAAEGKAQLERLAVCSAVPGVRSVTEQISEFSYPTEFNPSGRESTGESTHRSVTTSTLRPVEKAKEGQGPKEAERTETTENTTRTVNDAKAPRIPGYPTAFETRNVGLTVDLEPTIDETGVGEMNLLLQEVRNLGTLKLAGVAAKYPFQPLFEMRKTTQTVPLVSGRQVCIGTLNAPPENGVNDRKDDGRTVLVFVRLNYGQP